MRLAPITRLVVLVATALATEAGVSASGRALPEPIATRQTLFAIPFQIDEPTSGSRQPVEVQLYVSVDRGVNWQLYGKTPPTQRRFMFRAVDDGEYWFLVRTLDQFGQLWPQETGGPELRVVVDTTPPKLELQARQEQAGQITTRWNIDEAQLNPDSLKIQYRTDADGLWHSVAIGRQDLDTSASSHSNEVAWVPPVDSKQIQIRAEVADKAGNPAVSHAQIDLVANRPRNSVADPDPGAWYSSSSDIASEASAGIQRPGVAVQEASISSTEDADADPADSQYAANTYSDDRDWDGQYADDRYSQDPYSGSRNTQTGSVAAEVNPAVQRRFDPSNEPGTASNHENLSSVTTPKPVNSRLFELDYAVEAVDSSGIARVELWSTRDDGQTWEQFALDDDNRSPMRVKVAEEGRYGFRVVVTSGAGLGGRKPKRGEIPDVSIIVDLTKPTARIITVEPETGSDSGSMVITWDADDAMLADRPISILSSRTPGGPWTTIATGLENTGHYLWRADRLASDGAYLRLEALDAAGNVGEFETRQPIGNDRQRPAVFIRNVRPLGESARRQPKRYYFR